MPLDYSPLLAQVPQSPTSRGLSFVGDALDAVMERRRREEEANLQREAQKQVAAMTDARETERNNQQAESNRLARQGLEEERRKRDTDRDLDRRIRRQNARSNAMAQAAIIAQRPGGLALAKKFMDDFDRDEKAFEEEERAPMGAADPNGTLPPNFATGVMDPADAAVRAVAAGPVAAGAGGMGGPVQPPPVQPPPLPGMVMDPASAAVELAAGAAPPGPVPQPPPAPPPRPQPTASRADLLDSMSLKARADEFRAKMALRKDSFPPEVQAMIEPIADSIETGQETRGWGAIAGELSRLSAEKRAAMSASASEGRGDRTHERWTRVDARTDLKTLFDEEGYKASRVSDKSFDRMLAMADSALKGNSMAAGVFKGMFVKFAQGEVGVLTQNDMDVFWNDVGAPDERTEAALERALSGGLGEARARQAMSAVRRLLQLGVQRKEDLYEKAAINMEPYGAEGDRWLRTFFGKGLPGFDKGKGTPSGAPAPVAPPGKALSPEKRAKFLKELE